MGSSSILKAPFSLLMTVRVRPLSVCLAMTVAPGRTAPELSRTVPVIDAAAPCPNPRQLANTIDPKTLSTHGYVFPLIDISSHQIKQNGPRLVNENAVQKRLLLVMMGKRYVCLPRFVKESAA